MRKISKDVLGAGAIIFFLGSTFVLSCKLTAMPVQSTQKDASTSSAGVILGESRMAFGQYFRRMTNLYNHRGFEARRKAAFNDSIFQKWREHAAPQEHLHLEGIDAKEMLPWLWLAIKMDPHNIENYLVAAFSISTSIKRPDVAHQILLEAQRKNPFDYQIQLEDAIIFLREQNYAQAMRRLNSALILWPGDVDPESGQAVKERIYILSYKALLHEVKGEREKALECFREINVLQPGDKDLEHRIAILERGEDTSAKALEVLKALIEISDQGKSVCTYGEHDEDEEECEHHNH